MEFNFFGSTYVLRMSLFAVNDSCTKMTYSYENVYLFPVISKCFSEPKLGSIL